MTSPPFLILQNQYLSLQFLGWVTRRKSEGLHAETQPRYLFTMARYALYQGLRASGIVPGDEILMPAYICDAAVEAVRAFGAVPVFYRITRDCSIDLEDLENRISARSRALLFVHYFGFPQAIRPLRELADLHKLLLIEDCAHVLQGQSEGRALGTGGDFSIFSWRKFLPALDGAELRFNSAIFGQSPQLRREPLLFDLKALKYLLDVRFAGRKYAFSRALLDLPAKLLRAHHGSAASKNGSKDQQSSIALRLDGGSSMFHSSFVDSSISRVSRYVLTHSDPEAITAQRRANYAGLAERLADIPGVSTLHAHLPESICPLQLPVFVHNVPSAHRSLRALGIPATAWDGVRPSVLSDSAFPDAAFLYDNLVFLPIHQNLRDLDLDMIADAVNRVSATTSGTTRQAAGK